MYNRSHFARFLIANEFNIPKTIEHFKEFLNWRKSQKIDNLLVTITSLSSTRRQNSVNKIILKSSFQMDFTQQTKRYINKLTNYQGRPIFIVQFGNIKIKELLEIASADILIRYMLKEVEHTWRIKFNECTELAYKGGVD